VRAGRGRRLFAVRTPAHTDAHRFLHKRRDELTRAPVAVFGMGPPRDDPEAWASSRKQLDPALGQHAWFTPIATTMFGGRDQGPAGRHP
jgi:menaquinone-dependent protoporphyrinogen IX oxidase